MAKINILEDNNLCLVFVENKGYAILSEENDNINNIFLIKSDLTPHELNLEENTKDKNDFIELIHIFLNKIYDGKDIAEFNKKHHEHVFLEFIDLFEKELLENIENDSDLYNLINEGFIKFDIDVLSSNN